MATVWLLSCGVSSSLMPEKVISDQCVFSGLGDYALLIPSTLLLTSVRQPAPTTSRLLPTQGSSSG